MPLPPRLALSLLIGALLGGCAATPDPDPAPAEAPASTSAAEPRPEPGLEERIHAYLDRDQELSVMLAPLERALDPSGDPTERVRAFQFLEDTLDGGSDRERRTLAKLALPLRDLARAPQPVSLDDRLDAIGLLGELAYDGSGGAVELEELLLGAAPPGLSADDVDMLYAGSVEALARVSRSRRPRSLESFTRLLEREWGPGLDDADLNRLGCVLDALESLPPAELGLARTALETLAARKGEDLVDVAAQAADLAAAIRAAE